MHVDNEGHLIPLEKKRGRKKSIQGLVEHMEATANAPVADQVIGISHGDCIEDVGVPAEPHNQKIWRNKVSGKLRRPGDWRSLWTWYSCSILLGKRCANQLPRASSTFQCYPPCTAICTDRRSPTRYTNTI